jgi:hypothetical protein
LHSHTHTFYFLMGRSVGILLSDSLLKSAPSADAHGPDMHVERNDVEADGEMSDEALQQFMSVLESLQAHAPRESSGTTKAPGLTLCKR